jgi:phenylalanyl-tRNA synthetase beta chain
VYDADLIQSITIDFAKENEEITALDGKTYKLSKNTLVTRDGTILNDSLITVAGIIGAEKASVSCATKNILVESAYFDPISIAIAGTHIKEQKLKPTESMIRFERGTDINDVKEGLNAAVSLILEYANGSASSAQELGQVQEVDKKIIFSYTNLNKRLGDANLTFEKTVSYLKGLHCLFEHNDDLKKEESRMEITVIPPSFRHDLQIEEDLIEEVIRLHGYEHLGSLPLESAKVDLKKTKTDLTLADLKKRLIHLGFSECYTLSLTAEKKAKFFSD